MGFLSQSHQKTVQSNHVIQSQVDALSEEEVVLRSQIHIIDQTLSGLPETHVSRRINERKNSGYSEKQNRLLEIIKQKTSLETQLISGDDNSNPVLAIAKILKMDDLFIISLFIPFLVLILEPLSIGLTIAANVAWMNHKNEILAPVKVGLMELFRHRPGLWLKFKTIFYRFIPIADDKVGIFFFHFSDTIITVDSHYNILKPSLF
jgi:hypothetical protein